MKNILLLASVTCLLSCNNSSNQKSEPPKSSIEKPSSFISCDSSLNLLIQSTDISGELKNKEAIQDGITDDTLLIKLYHSNEAEKGSYVDASDGFLSIDLKNKKMFQLVVETDSLKAIKFDEKLLENYIKNCLSK